MESLLHDVNSEKDAAAKMGITYEEKAFYDILKAVRDKYEFPYEEERLIDLAKQIKLIIDDKSRYVDWATRTDRKAELKMDIVITLAKNKYPPFTKDEVFKEILEQAENFKKNRLVDGYEPKIDEPHFLD
jgi:type I restriction enzyme R subunit